MRVFFAIESFKLGISVFIDINALRPQSILTFSVHWPPFPPGTYSCPGFNIHRLDLPGYQPIIGNWLHSTWQHSPGLSVQFSHSVMSNSLQPHEPQHARPLCPSPTPGVHPPMSIESVMPSNHLTLYCPLLLLPSIFPSIRVFSNESVLHQSIGISASASVLPMNIQD